MKKRSLARTSSLGQGNVIEVFKQLGTIAPLVVSVMSSALSLVTWSKITGFSAKNVLQEQKDQCVAIIKAGGESGVDTLELGSEANGGVSIEPPDGGDSPARATASDQGKMTLKVKYK